MGKSLEDILWEAAEPRFYLTKEEFLKSLEGWNIQPVSFDGELAWITAQKGPEFHFQSVGQTKSMPRRMIKDFLQNIVAQHGYAQTRTPHEDERQHRFNLAFGFHEAGRDAFDVIYRIGNISCR